MRVQNDEGIWRCVEVCRSRRLKGERIVLRGHFRGQVSTSGSQLKYSTGTFRTSVSRQPNQFANRVEMYRPRRRTRERVMRLGHFCGQVVTSGSQPRYSTGTFRRFVSHNQSIRKLLNPQECSVGGMVGVRFHVGGFRIVVSTLVVMMSAIALFWSFQSIGLACFIPVKTLESIFYMKPFNK